MGWITLLALIALVVLIGMILLALKAELKGKQAHTEVRSSKRPTLPATRSLAPPPTTLDPPEPVAAPSDQSPMVEAAEAPAASRSTGSYNQVGDGADAAPKLSTEDRLKVLEGLAGGWSGNKQEPTED